MKPKNRSRTSQQAFTLVELAIVVVIIGILVAMLLPGLGSARKSANESSAIAGVRTLYVAQIQYRTRFGQFASPLGQLQEAGLTHDFKVSGDALVKSGYEFLVHEDDRGRVVWARPLDPGSTGDRYFAIGPRGIIRYAEGRRPEESDPAVDTTTTSAEPTN